MKANPRLFDRVAPMGVADIALAVSYKFVQQLPMGVPITSFDGLLDYTIAPGNVGQWAGYTRGAFSNVPVNGDHYFVASHAREVRRFVLAAGAWPVQCMRSRPPPPSWTHASHQGQWSGLTGGMHAGCPGGCR